MCHLQLVAPLQLVRAVYLTPGDIPSVLEAPARGASAAAGTPPGCPAVHRLGGGGSGRAPGVRRHRF